MDIYMIHAMLTKAAETHPVGVLFVIGAIAAMAIQTGAMYKLLRPFSLLITIAAASYGVYGIYYSGNAGTFFLGMICCGFGFYVGNYFTSSVRKAWYPETILKKYKQVPQLPDLNTLTKEQLVKELTQLHQLAVRQEKKLQELKPDGVSEEDDSSSSGISIKFR